MYRIGVVSDTHGLLRPEVTQGLQGCDAILHGGDINSRKILDELNEIAPVYAVRGNNDKDWAEDLPQTVTVELFGVRIFMVHNLKHIPDELTDVDIVVYGHSHKYEEKEKAGILFLNPGSCGPRRFTQPVTYAELEIGEAGSFTVVRKDVPHSSPGRKGEAPLCAETEIRMKSGDMKRIVKAVMRDTDKHISVEQIAVRNGISRELAETVCRLYVTHPGVSADGILGKMGL